MPRLVLTSTSSPHLRTARPEAPAQGLRADTVRHTRPASTPQGILPSWGATTRGRCLTLPHSLVGEAWPGSGRKTRSGLRATPLGWKPERRRRGPALRAPARRLRSNAGASRRPGRTTRHVCAAPAMEFERSPTFNRIAESSVPATVLFRQVRRCGRAGLTRAQTEHDSNQNAPSSHHDDVARNRSETPRLRSKARRLSIRWATGERGATR